MQTERAFESGSQYPVRKPGTLRLYGMRFCPYVKRTILALEQKNIPYEVININLSKKPEWYLEKINCLGLVPAIENDDAVVYDSVIINEYLDTIYPNNKLLSGDPYQAARDRMLLEVWTAVVTQYYKVYYRTGNDEEAIKQMLVCLDRVENELKARKSKFFGGDSPMMIDFNIWPNLERITGTLIDVLVPGFKFDTARFQHLTSYIESMSSLPVVEKTKLRPDWFRRFIELFRKGETDYNIGLEE